MFDFSEYHDVGDYLALIKKEANIRSGISRYYYSGFGIARMYLIYDMNEYEFINRNDIHQRVCKRLMDSDDDTEASVGEKLDDLRQLRNEADYDWNLDWNYFLKKLSTVQKDSLDIINQINTLKKSPPFKIN